MRRDFTALWLFLLLGALAALALLTAYPESRLAKRAESWPVAGPLVSRIRDLYRPPPASPPAEPEVEIVVLPRSRPTRSNPPATPGAPGRRPRVWVPPGTPLYAEPDAAGEPLRRFDDYGYHGFAERSGDWYRLEWHDAELRAGGGWVRLPGYREPSREELWRPAPVVPLPAAPPDDTALARARELMGALAEEHDCGPYRLLSDRPRGALHASCARLARSLESVYRGRYGVAPVGRPAGAILAFGRATDFSAFSRDYRNSAGSQGFATPSRGFVALPPGGDQRARLVHELTHLLNRRALGPALPPWLEEGLAEDLALSRIDATGALVPGSLAGSAVAAGQRTAWLTGGLAAVRQLLAWRAGGVGPSLEQLVTLDAERFRTTGSASLHYSLAGLWVRYLLDGAGEPTAAAFRSYLAAVAAGEPVAAGRLPERLGRDWPELEAGFRDWAAGLSVEGA